MREWVEKAFQGCVLTEFVEGYMLARGATSEWITKWGITSWVCPEEPCPSQAFRESFGEHGEFFEGRLLIPLVSPRGRLLGWESRVPYDKQVNRFLINDSPWDPVFLGIQTALPRLWERSSTVWVVEGIFDVCALMQARPSDVVLGTGPARLTRSQETFLKRFAVSQSGLSSLDVRLAFDQDNAGQKATAAALKNLKFLGVQCQSFPYGKVKDPGSVWDQGGREAVLRVFGS